MSGCFYCQLRNQPECQLQFRNGKVVNTPCHRSEEETFVAQDVKKALYKQGRWIRQRAVRHNMRHRHGCELEGDDAERTQALAHVCEGVGEQSIWRSIRPDVNTFRRPDLRGLVEVKHITEDHKGVLIRPSDIKEKGLWTPFCGVFLSKGMVRTWVRGWTVAALAREEYSISPHGRPPVYAMPQQKLFPVSALRRIIKILEAKYPHDCAERRRFFEALVRESVRSFAAGADPGDRRLHDRLRHDRMASDGA